MASEFIEEWNKVQPLHIKESDLKNPTESFVRKCVCLLMRQMLVKLDFMENVSSFHLTQHFDVYIRVLLFSWRLTLIAKMQELGQREFDWFTLWITSIFGLVLEKNKSISFWWICWNLVSLCGWSISSYSVTISIYFRLPKNVHGFEEFA